MNTYAQIIDKLIAEFDEPKLFSERYLGSIVSRTEMLIKNIYGDKSNYLDEFKAIQFKPEPKPGPVDIHDIHHQKAFRQGIGKLIDLLKIISLDTQLREVKK